MTDRKQLADEALAQAETLIGQKKMSDQEFLESMARCDSLIDHDPEECGQCGHQFIMAQVARDMLAAGDIEDGIRKWSDEATKRWQEGKYFKLWQEATAQGRDPNEVFAEKGWEP